MLLKSFISSNGGRLSFGLWAILLPVLELAGSVWRVGIVFRVRSPRDWNFPCMELNFITVLGWPLHKDLTLIQKWEFCRHQPPALFIFALESMQRKKKSKFYLRPKLLISEYCSITKSVGHYCTTIPDRT